ncbi:MAG: NPCBM/NEW2 domain-containing protein [Isosphaeraceae bacterium]
MRNIFNRLDRIVLAITLSAACGACPGQEKPAVEFLSDQLASSIVSSTQGWGSLGVNTAVRPGGRPAAPLQIKDRTYQHGLGHHAPGEIVVDLGGQFQLFQADLGIQWQGGRTTGSVVFQVYVDDKKVFDSGVVHETDPAHAVAVPVEDAQELRLVVTDAGDGITCDCADWADARLTRNPAAKPSNALAVDVAHFGRIMSWDPAKKTGTTASRVGEFPREDIEPGREILRDPDGLYPVLDWNGRGCLGMQWYESRRLRRVELEFTDDAAVPSWESIEPEIWIGESAWQGRWEPLKARHAREGRRLSWLVEGPAGMRATPKIRWCFNKTADRPIRIKTVSAFTRSRWKPVDVEIASRLGMPTQQIPIKLYNGAFADSPGDSTHQRVWDSSHPLQLRLLASVARADKTDRTVLRFKLPEPGFGVAVEDVLARGAVDYAGIRVSTTEGRVPRAPSPSTETILAQVRKRPDQTLDRALAVVHKPIQDLGPMMLSLACDNRKIVADRDGTVHFNLYEGLDETPAPFPDQWRLDVHAGRGTDLKMSRHLHGSWLPLPVTIVRDGPVVYRQTTFVAPVDDPKPGRPVWGRDRALGVVEFHVKNEGQANADAKLELGFAVKGKARLGVHPGHGLSVISHGGRVIALVDNRAAAPLEVMLDSGGVSLFGRLPPGKEARSVVLLPLWNATARDEPSLASDTPWLERTEAYWKALLADAMSVTLPDAFLTNLIKASQVHCLLAARCEAGGARVSPWISSDRYGPLESEANAVIRGMDLLGQTEFARRSLEFFISRYDPRGFLTTGYTLVGTGEHLWTLAEHYERTRDRAWLTRVAPGLLKICDWIVAQRAKTKRLDVHGWKVPEYGLMPPGVTADWNRYAYRFFNDAQYCAGLAALARVLADCGNPGAASLEEEARKYREDLLAAYHWTQARSPVLWLGDGTWGPAQPALLGSFGRCEEFLPGEDGNRSWAYSVEIGAHHLAALGILDPTSSEVSAMLDYLEDFQFLRTGMGEYPEQTNRQDPFNDGGFAKVQPFYARVAEVYALRDEVKPFVRSYFNALAAMVSRENLSLWEHFHNQGGWNKTHETGWFLCQTRIMLVQERGPDLWLAPMVTDQWLKGGALISVRNAPTRFGKVGYSIRPAADLKSVDAEIIPPTSPAGLRNIVIRVRHPEGKPFRAVTVAGHPHPEFNVKARTISLRPAATPLNLHIEY